MHRHPAEASLPTVRAARNTRDTGGHELDEFIVEGLEQDGWLVSDDGMFTISERKLTVDEQVALAAAKHEELQSFFDNAVWGYTHEADPSRTMKARYLLKWRDGHRASATHRGSCRSGLLAGQAAATRAVRASAGRRSPNDGCCKLPVREA